MRVIAGRFRSRKLKPVPGDLVRPTPDRLRETLFNVIALRLDGRVFLDAYAGTGAVALEALSRGARHAVLIEPRRQAINVIRENVAALGLEQDVTILHGYAVQFLSKWPADIAFVDPPYDQRKEYTASLEMLAATKCELVIAQHASRHLLEDRYGRLARTRTLRQGDNSLSFYQPEER